MHSPSFFIFILHELQDKYINKRAPKIKERKKNDNRKKEKKKI
jgi:hypothetical protein